MFKFFIGISLLHLFATVIYGGVLVHHCGLNRGSLLTLFQLAPMSFIAWSFITQSWENIFPGFRRRVKITEGDVMVLRFFSPWLHLILQLSLCIFSIYTLSDFFKNGAHPRACELRSRYK